MRQDRRRAADQPRIPVQRDDGPTLYAEVPSLWRQAQSVLRRIVDRGAAGAPASERTPLDLDLLEITATIHGTVARELHARGLLRTYRGDGDETRLRHLAGQVAGDEPAQLCQWENLFTAWARLLARALNVGEHQPPPVRLRNSPCPACASRQVSVDTADGPRRVPALVIDFNRGLVRAAQCEACGAQWARGLELEHLAGLLGA
jgi:hypothetical protein